MAKQEPDAATHFFGGTTETEELDLTLESSEVAETVESGVEGEIAVDVINNDTNVVIVSPIAGVDPTNIEIVDNGDDTITISGERTATHLEKRDRLLVQEIYWGKFSRTITLPGACNTDKAVATCEHGVLTVRIPKANKARKKTIKVRTAK